MAKQEHLDRLFDAHISDLNDILTESDNVMVCPICLKVFSKEAIKQGLVNDGHVWPKDIRKVSKKAGPMQVVLCTSCNGRSSPADKQMQLYEKIRKGDESGEWYGTRRVQLFEEDSDSPLELQGVDIRLIKGKTLTFTSNVYKSGDIERFLTLHGKDKPMMKSIIFPPKDFRPEIIPAAWVTSAYLMAYYALGYRYIFQPSMQVVRDYILKSFDNSAGEMAAPREKNFSLTEYEKEYFPDPEIGMMYPVEKDKLAFIQVSFLSFEIHLPFMYEPSAMKFLMDHIESYHTEGFKEQVESGEPFFFGIKCTKTIAHTCMYDLIMGAAGHDAGEAKRLVFLKDSSELIYIDQ